MKKFSNEQTEQEIVNAYAHPLRLPRNVTRVLALVTALLTLVCLILKLCVSYFFPISRLLLFVFIPLALLVSALFLGRIIFLAVNRKPKGIVRSVVTLLLCLCTLGFAADRSLDSTLERARFYTAKGFYTQTAEPLAEKGASLPVGEWEFAVSRFPEKLLTPHSSPIYGREEGYTWAAFEASSGGAASSLSHWYVYVSEVPNAGDLPPDYFRSWKPLSGDHWYFAYRYSGSGIVYPDL